jgi:hydroxyacylglutathione hydrolase
MAMVFERLKVEGIAQLSYLIGDDSSGTAAVIDPQPNVERYLQLARKHGVRITHVLETHIHADFMSGARSLVARLGDARLCVSQEGGAEYGFEADRIGPGESIKFGSQTLRARHTPGHTPEHMSFELIDASRPDHPWAVFCGDALFVQSVGRPDLLGDEKTEELERQLYETLYDYFLKLEDGVIILPCHGAGSACGPEIGDRPFSTIGVERATNPYLQHESAETFFKALHEGAPPVPAHYPILKKLNADGPPILEASPVIPALLPHEFFSKIQEGQCQLVDTRQMLAFGGGHIPKAINIGNRPSLAVWAGTMLDYGKPILLVVEDDQKLDDELWQFVSVGLTNFAGYLVEGMKAWEEASFATERVPQVTVHDLEESEECQGMQLLDVRSAQEYQSGHIPGASHCYVADLRDGMDGADKLDDQEPVAVYCGSGYRASIAASLLKARGFQRVCNVPGSMKAWKNAGMEVSDD